MMPAELRSLSDAQLEREHRRLLQERDVAHNHLRRLDRDLDAVRAERLARTGAAADGEEQC